MEAFRNAVRVYVGDANFALLCNQYAEFTDFFDIDQDIITQIHSGGRIIMRLSVDNEYTLWVNGAPVSFGQHPSFPGDACYEEVDIAPYIFPGENNKIALLSYHLGKSNSTYKKGTPGVIFEITSKGPADTEPRVILSSSKETYCRISPAYSSGEIPSVSGQNGYTFEYDQTADDGWERCDYILPTASGTRMDWRHAKEVASDTLDFAPRPIKKVKLIDTKPVRVTSQGIFDYGQEYRGAHKSSAAYYMQYAALKTYSIAEMIRGGSQTLAGGAHPMMPGYAGVSSSAENSELKLGFDFGGETGARTLFGKGIFAVVDLLEEECGYALLDIEAPEGTIINVAYGDHLDDLRVRAYVGGRNYSFSYICGKGRSQFASFIHRIAGRFMMIYAECSEITIHAANIIPVRYPIDPDKEGRFLYSDALHQKIHDVSLHTLLLCMHEHYEDCPHREQALYAMDSRNQMLCGYYAFGEYNFAKESIRLLAKGLRSDGLLELCAPGEVSVTIPSFALHWIIELAEYALYSGDLRFVSEMLPTAEKIMNHFTLHSIPGKALLLWRGDPSFWNFHEWSPGLDSTLGMSVAESSGGNCFDANLTALFITVLERLAQTYAFMGMTDGFMDDKKMEHMTKASNYMDLCEGMRKQFNSFFYDANTGLYASYSANGKLVDYSEFTNAMAIYCGAADGLIRKTVAEALMGRFPTVNGKKTSLTPATLSMLIFKYEALILADSANIDYVMKDIERLWGYMLYNNATSFWETIEGGSDFYGAGSLCHGWSAIPLIIYYKYILGFRPTRPGFREYAYNPRQYKCHEASGSVWTKNGRFDFDKGTMKAH